MILQKKNRRQKYSQNYYIVNQPNYTQLYYLYLSNYMKIKIFEQRKY